MFETAKNPRDRKILATIVIAGMILFSITSWFPSLYLMAASLYVFSFILPSEKSLSQKIIVNTIGLILLIAIKAANFINIGTSSLL